MKTILITFMLTVFSLGMQATELDTRSYLKIELNEHKHISYPPNTDFVAKDTQGTVLLNPEKLEKLKMYVVEKPITLYVFTYWNDEPDVYNLKSGTLYMKKTYLDFSKILEKQKHKASDAHSNGQKDDSKQKIATKHIVSNNVYLIGKRYFDYDDTNGYDVRLEFSNGVVFTYENGFVKAMQNGYELTVKNKYMVNTEKGTLKISYNPKTKKVWWVFDKR